MSESIINTIHTPCKDCVFAQYVDKTQTGCHMNLLEKFRINNIEILEAYDEEKEFYIINKKKCFAYKDNKYFIARKLSDLSLSDKIDYVQNILHINYLAVINLDNIELSDIEKICNILMSSVAKPKKILFIRYYHHNKKYKYEDIKSILDNIQIKWRIQTILDSSLTYRDILHTITNTNKKYNCILSIDGYEENIDKIIYHAEDCVFNKFTSFIVISNKNHNILLYNNLIYRIGLIKGVDILKNIEEYTIV